MYNHLFKIQISLFNGRILKLYSFMVTHLGLVKPPVGVDNQNVPGLKHNLKAIFSPGKISIFLTG